MPTLLDDRWLTARKEHGCNACLGRIAPGDRYRRQRLVDYGDAWTFKAHELCDAVYWHCFHEMDLMDDEPGPDPAYDIHPVLRAVLAVFGGPTREEGSDG